MADEATPAGDGDFPELPDPDLRELAQALRAQPDLAPDGAWKAATKERLLRAFDAPPPA